METSDATNIDCGEATDRLLAAASDKPAPPGHDTSHLDLREDGGHESSAVPLLQTLRPQDTQSQDAQVPNTNTTTNNGDSDDQEGDMASPASSIHTLNATLPRNRVGTLATWTIALSTTAIAGCTASLAFLWFSSASNKTWQWIVVNDHLITLVTGLAKGVETSIQLQISIVSAMLAACILERSNVPLKSAASVSITRLSGGSVNLLLNLWQQIRYCRVDGLDDPIIIILMSLIAICLGSSQVVAILLNRNIRLVSMIGFNESVHPAFSFAYDYSTNASEKYLPYTWFPQNGWLAPLDTFPAFSEYSKDGMNQVGVSDTGETLRAFLPYVLSSDRERIQSYEGQATVIDTRVTCQTPQLLQATISSPGPGWSLVLSGLVGASQQTPRLNNQTIVPVAKNYTPSHEEDFDKLIPFQCMVPSFTSGAIDGEAAETVLPKQWRIALCQLPEGGSEDTMFSGGLISEFEPLQSLDLDDLYGSNGSLESQNWGQAYMFLNVTLGDHYNWTGALNDGYAYPVPAYQVRNEWKDLVFSDGTLVLSTTVCYTSFASADLPVVMSSSTNRTEPSTPYDFSQSRFLYDTVRRQMGQSSSANSVEDRGILSLHPQRDNWLAKATELPPVEPYVRRYFDMKVGQYIGEDANWTAILWDCQAPQNISANGNWILPDSSIITLFQEIVSNGGSVDFALQSIYTLLASEIYYKKLPLFDAVANGSRVDFKLVNAPASYWGFFVVLALVLVHSILIAFALLLFLHVTRWTYLGQSWITISQTRGKAMDEHVLSGCIGMSDSEVDDFLAKQGMRNTRVGLRLEHGQTWPEIVEWRKNDGSVEG